MTQEINGKTLIVWQSGSGAGVEQPVIIRGYTGSLTIEQDGSAICILPEHADEIAKAIRKMSKEC